MSAINALQSLGAGQTASAQTLLTGGGIGRMSRKGGDSAAMGRLDEGKQGAGSAKDRELEKRLGELIGSALLMPALKKMQESPFETKYSSGGKSEGVFKGQLALELSQKTGRAMSHAFAHKLVDAVQRRTNASASESSGGTV